MAVTAFQNIKEQKSASSVTTEVTQTNCKLAGIAFLANLRDLLSKIFMGNMPQTPLKFFGENLRICGIVNLAYSDP